MANPSSNRGRNWSAEQIQNARIIAQVGRAMGMSSRDILIALMTALQESGLRNLNYGDRDSLGLFQQRPSQGWGTPQQIMDPRYAARKFFERLAQIRNRNNLELWQAAQKVQISAFPRAYAKWESSARQLLSQIGNVAPDLGGFTSTPMEFGIGMEPQQPSPMGQPGTLEASPGGDSPMVSAMDKLLEERAGAGDQQGDPEALGTQAADEAIDWSQWTVQDMLMPEAQGIPGGPLDLIGEAGEGATGIRAAVINLAKRFIGVPYRWGGADPSGFDCSGLVQYVLGQMGVHVPRLAYQQANYGEQTSIANLRPGDLVFWGNSRRTQGNHIAFYLGNGMILEAPRPGLSVRIRRLGQWDKDDGAIGVRLNY